MNGNLANLMPRLRPVETEESGPDPSEVRDARLTLWRKIPEAYRVKWEDVPKCFKPEARPILDAAMSWDWESPSLLICAPTDYAKSLAVGVILRRLMGKNRENEWRRWKGIHWFGVPELMTSARSWPLGSGDCPDVRLASRCELAILDDLGNETPHGSVFFEVTQSRFQRELTTITTSGLPVRELIQRNGECILRRLVQRDGKLGTIIDLFPKGTR